ncbi:uncharacterized protein LOC108113078 [Drosophila eugracilis]|uniref:uncharacterized protein LOC108113078 n=1 Tax=Drosophila eugracilis TaxID=29029 RepID=UPI0007E65F8F|nr:uncharacterized protein LOC108113078 [Drosophila eugracilis]
MRLVTISLCKFAVHKVVHETIILLRLLLGILPIVFYMVHVSNANPLLFFKDVKSKVMNKIFGHFHNKFIKEDANVDSIPQTKPIIEHKENDKKGNKFMGTLLKLCQSEMGSKENAVLEAIVGQSINNINTIKNNISMPEIEMPPITVVIVKDQKSLEKYQKQAKNPSSNATIIINRSKPAQRSMARTAYAPDVKKCVLLKMKELNVIKE